MNKNNDNYNGTACFEYEIERYKSKVTGEYITIDDAEGLARNQDENWLDENYIYSNLIIDIEGRSYFIRGRFNCSNDDAYPDEGETEILSVLLGKEDWEDKLTSSEREYIIDMIVEGAIENFAGDPDDKDYDD